MIKHFLIATSIGILSVSPIAQAGTAAKTIGYLNFRNKPTTIESEILDTLSPNTLVKFEDSEVEGWSKIEWKNQVGYVYNKYLSTDLNQEYPVDLSTETQLTKEYEPNTFKRQGVIHWGEWRWTWYSEKVLPGGGLKIPGRTTNSDGYVCDENGYICLASVDLSKGTVVETPFGYYGKVYDSGCPSGTLDVYVNW